MGDEEDGIGMEVDAVCFNFFNGITHRYDDIAVIELQNLNLTRQICFHFMLKSEGCTKTCFALYCFVIQTLKLYHYNRIGIEHGTKMDKK